MQSGKETILASGFIATLEVQFQWEASAILQSGDFRR